MLTHRGRDVHRMNNVGEYHCDLLVLSAPWPVQSRNKPRAAQRLQVALSIGRCQPDEGSIKPQLEALPARQQATLTSRVPPSTLSGPPSSPYNPMLAFTVWTRIDCWLKRAIPSTCRRSELPTRDRVFKVLAANGLSGEHSYGIASAHCMCPSKPSDVAIAR